jgi:hypothetical protein
MIEKPVIFISHSSKDAAIALPLTDMLTQAGLSVFCSSDSDAIDAGANWMTKLMRQLDKATFLIVIVSENSASSSWVNFEIGYLWKKWQKLRKKPILPLGIGTAEAFGVIRQQNLEIKHLDTVGGLTNAFKVMARNFDSRLSRLNFDEIVSKFNLVLSIEIEEKDIQQLLEDHLRKHKTEKDWIVYSRLDEELKLPTGSSSRYLVEVAKPLGYEVVDNSLTGVRLTMIYNYPKVRVKRDIW